MKTKIILASILSLVVMATAVAQTKPGKTKPVKTTKNGKPVNTSTKGSTATPTNSNATVPVSGTKEEGAGGTTLPSSSKPAANATATPSTTEEGRSEGRPAVSNTVQTPTTTVDEPFRDLVEQSRPVVTETANGQINYSEQYVEAKGSAVIDNEKFKNPAQARLMAERGAIVVAQRNLLEMVKGVNVIGETTVQDMVTTGDYVYSRVEGIVKGAKQFGPSREENGAVTVTLRMPLYDNNNGVAAGFSATGLENARRSSGFSQEATTVIQAGADLISGDKPIAFNIGGKKIDPSMFPVIVDEQGKLLLDFSKVYQKTGKVPKIIQSTKDIFEATGFKKGVDVIDLVQGNKGQLTLADPNKKGKINWAKIGNIAGSIGKVLLNILM